MMQVFCVHFLLKQAARRGFVRYNMWPSSVILYLYFYILCTFISISNYKLHFVILIHALKCCISFFLVYGMLNLQCLIFWILDAI